MTRKGFFTIRIIGWLYAIFLGISYAFFKDELSFITYELPGALIAFIIGLILILYDFGYKKKEE